MVDITTALEEEDAEPAPQNQPIAEDQVSYVQVKTRIIRSFLMIRRNYLLRKPNKMFV